VGKLVGKAFKVKSKSQPISASIILLKNADLNRSKKIVKKVKKTVGFFLLVDYRSRQFFASLRGMM